MQQCCSRSASVRSAITLCLALSAALARADEDSLDGPWSTIHGNNAGTAATTAIPYTLGEGPMEEKWRLDVVTPGQDRPGGRSSIVFDRDGNLYWITNNTGGTGGIVRLVSASTAGSIRWFGNDGSGNVHSLGSRFSGATPVVGQARVYGIGEESDLLMIAAYDKATGRNLWSSQLPPSSGTDVGRTLTPVLYRGKLYAVGISEGKSQDVHKIDAETGDVEWSSTIIEVAISTSIVGQMTFVPDAFEAGVHGLYFNGDSGQPADGIADAYGIQIHEGEAAFGWASDAGKVGRSHVIYSAADNRLYTLTWSDYGAQLYTFDPAVGLVNAYQNSRNTGHGFYDVGALDFDGSTLIAGGFDGYILRYTPAEDGSATDEVIYKGGSVLDGRFWGENRVNGQLLQDASENSVLICGTNSLMGCGTHIVALDVTRRQLLWEYDTGNIWDHQFLYAGGPILGPDGKVYYFERRNPALVEPGLPTTTLIAIGLATSEPKPTAGLLMVGHEGREIRGISPDQCIRTSELIRLDGACSTGKTPSFSYSVEPPDDVEVVHASAMDPYATLRFHFEGTYIIRLVVQNAAGSDEYAQEVCVANAAPVCALAITDLTGGPLDDADDEDDVPCLAVGATALADAGASFGGNLDATFTVDPSEGVDLEAVDSLTPQSRVTFSTPGTYTISVALMNELGSASCGPVTVCVVTAGGTQLPGDMDQDAKLLITDAVRLLGHLFLGTFPTLPCEGGSAGAPGPGDLALVDSNGDSRIDISDALYTLNWLFTGTNGPPVLGVECLPIVGCPDNSVACGNG